MRYVKPAVSDYGTLTDITRASGILGSEDGVGKVVLNVPSTP